MAVEHARVGTHEVAYRDVGRGDIVVLLHDKGGTMADWAEVVPALSDDHRVICFEARTPQTMAEDAIDVLDWIGVQQAVFVGKGAGVAAAEQLAEREPGRVARVIAIEGGDPAAVTASLLEQLAAQPE